MAAKPFMITGLPRSRTAWMAAFMTFGKVICTHEPIKTLSDKVQIPELFKSEYHTHIGISDSTAGFFMPEIMELVRPATVIIVRPRHEVKASMKEIGLPCDRQIDMLCEELGIFKSHPDVITVAYDKLNDIRTMSKIWFHCLPGVPFDEERFANFKNLHIEADIPALVKYVEDNKFRCLNLMREVIVRAKAS